MRLFLHDMTPDRRAALFAALTQAGLRAEMLDSPAAVRGLAGLAAEAAGLLALILGQDGGTAALLAALRAAGAEFPVIIVTDRRQAERDATLLDAGACDVMAVPVHAAELAARLRAAMRRRNGLARAEMRFGELLVHLDGRDPEFQGQPVSLSTKENSVLCLLATNRGRVVARRAIFDLLYGLSDYQPFDKTIDIHICRIRTKLAQVAPQGRDCIETYPGRGYALRVITAAEAAG
jgi:two-component system cell cycle response regulator CtrA